MNYLISQMARAVVTYRADVECIFLRPDAFKELCREVERDAAYRTRHPYAQPGDLERTGEARFMDVLALPMIRAQAPFRAELHCRDWNGVVTIRPVPA